MNKKIIALIIWILVFQIIGYFLGTITDINSTDWYHSLQKSSLTPPAIIFPIVWSILYAMLALSGWFLWQHRQQSKITTALILFGAQMILNWAWPVLFFNFHLIAVSFCCLLFITFLTLITILITKKELKFISILLIPYFLWLIFASYLNGAIWILN